MHYKYLQGADICEGKDLSAYVWNGAESPVPRIQMVSPHTGCVAQISERAQNIVIVIIRDVLAQEKVLAWS